MPAKRQARQDLSSAADIMDVNPLDAGAEVLDAASEGVGSGGTAYPPEDV